MPGNDISANSNSRNVLVQSQWCYTTSRTIIGPTKQTLVFFFFYPSLKFDFYINNIVNRSNKILGFVHRDCAVFNDTRALKSSTIYCCWVRSISEQIWLTGIPTDHRVVNIKLRKFSIRFYVYYVLRKFSCQKNAFFVPSLTLILNLETFEQRSSFSPEKLTVLSP